MAPSVAVLDKVVSLETFDMPAELAGRFTRYPSPLAFALAVLPEGKLAGLVLVETLQV